MLDRFVLHKATVSDPTNLNRPETKTDHRENILGKLILKVIDEDTKSAIPTSKVFVNQISRICDYSGSVFFYNLDPDSTHSLTVNKDGYEEYNTNFEIDRDTLLYAELKKSTTHIFDFSTSEFDVKIAPNPIGNSLHVISKELIEEITITDITGKKVYQSKHLSDTDIMIELGHLKNGIYFARIFNSGKLKMRVMKFIKIDLNP